MVMVVGETDPRFASVRDSFAALFEASGDERQLGAAVSVRIDGRTVVDLWGGWADVARTRPWTADTLVNCYSVGKPFVALAVLALAGRGEIDLDARADRYWPELAAGRAGATVRMALCHQAGVPAIRERLTNDDLWDWDRMTAALAATEPWWVPGERHAYHTNTYGFLTGEIARRVTGLTPGEWLRRDVAGPLGADVYWGLATDELARCADVDWRTEFLLDPPSDDELAALGADPAMIALGYANPPGFSGLGVMNTAEFRRAEIPSTNLHGSARGVSRVYEVLAHGGSRDGVTVVDSAVLREASTVQSDGWCPVLERDVAFGLGFQLSRPERPLGPNLRSFGHYGTGGSLGFADPDARLGFGFVANAVVPRWQSPHNRRLVQTVYACLG